MTAPVKDISGLRFGKLVAGHMIATHTKYGAMWQCECDCGTSYNVRGSALRHGVTTSCKSCARKTARLSKANPPQNVPLFYLRNVLINAEKRKIDFHIDISDAQLQYDKQNGLCALSGVEIAFALYQSSKGDMSSSASLDRINNNIGYLKSNIQWLHKDVNRIKKDMPEELFLKMCKIVSKHYDKNNSEN